MPALVYEAELVVLTSCGKSFREDVKLAVLKGNDDYPVFIYDSVLHIILFSWTKILIMCQIPKLASTLIRYFFFGSLASRLALDV